MKTTLVLIPALLMAACASNPRASANHSFFGGEQGELAESSNPSAPAELGPSEWEIDTGMGVAVTPPKTWASTEPNPDAGITLTSPNKSTVTLEALKDDGEMLENVRKWHEDLAKLASNVVDPLAESELAGQKSWSAKYQFMVDDAVVSRTVWEMPHDGTFYRLHVQVAELGDRYETQTILDSLRFVNPTQTDELRGELLGASVYNKSLGKSRISVSGWQKAESCEQAGCVGSWLRDDASITVIRRDFASETAARRDVDLGASQLERIMEGTSRPAKYGKNNGKLVDAGSRRVWLGSSGKSLWTVKLEAGAGPSGSVKAFERTIASARFK